MSENSSSGLLAIEVTEAADGRFIAKAPSIVGAEAEGATPEEATQRVRELALKLLAYKIDSGEQVASERVLTKSRRFAVYFAAVQLLAMLVIDGLWYREPCLIFSKAVIFLAPAMVLIVYCRRLAGFRGPAPRFHFVDQPTPELALVALGWMALLAGLVFNIWGWLVLANRA